MPTKSLKISNFLKTIRENPYVNKLRGVFLFVLITLVIHFSFRFWAHTLHYFPIREAFTQASLFMEDVVLQQSSWFIIHVLRIPTTLQDHTMWFQNHGGILISSGCTGLKQIIQVLLLFLIYPGPLKHKAWFIPSGIVIIHMTNILRIILLALAIISDLPHIEFIHTYILRPLFYVVIFFMWWIWAEKIAHEGRKSSVQNPV